MWTYQQLETKEEAEVEWLDSGEIIIHVLPDTRDLFYQEVYESLN